MQKIDFTKKWDVIEHFKFQIHNQRGRVNKVDIISSVYIFECNTV